MDRTPSSIFRRKASALRAQLGGQTTRVVDRVVMLSDAYVHANDEAARRFCRAAQACLDPKHRAVFNLSALLGALRNAH